MRKIVLAGLTAVTAGAISCVTLGGSAAGADTTTGTITGYSISAGRATAIPANSAGTSVVADAFCPVGKVVLSGGVTDHSPRVFIRTSYPTDSRTWQVAVTPSQNIGYAETFTPYAICADAASVPGYHQVLTASRTISYGPTDTSSGLAVGDAYCAAGEYVVGGGVQSHSPYTWLSVSRPTSDTRAWEAGVVLTRNPGYSGESYKVAAVCVPNADISSYAIVNTANGAYGTQLTVAQPTNTAASPYCGTGLLAIAAGATNHDNTKAFISSITPTSSEKYWLVTSTDTNPPSYGEWFTPVGICVSATS